MATIQTISLTLSGDVDEYRSSFDSFAHDFDNFAQSGTVAMEPMLEDIEEYINSLSRLGEDGDDGDDQEVCLCVTLASKGLFLTIVAGCSRPSKGIRRRRTINL